MSVSGRVVTACVALAPVLRAMPGSAQSSLTRNWTPLRLDDDQDRGPGPDLGDCFGLPIKTAARRFVDRFGCVTPDAAGPSGSQPHALAPGANAGRDGAGRHPSTTIEAFS